MMIPRDCTMIGSLHPSCSKVQPARLNHKGEFEWPYRWRKSLQERFFPGAFWMPLGYICSPPDPSSEQNSTALLVTLPVPCRYTRIPTGTSLSHYRFPSPTVTLILVQTHRSHVHIYTSTFTSKCLNLQAQPYLISLSKCTQYSHSCSKSYKCLQSCYTQVDRRHNFGSSHMWSRSDTVNTCLKCSSISYSLFQPLGTNLIDRMKVTAMYNRTWFYLFYCRFSTPHWFLLHLLYQFPSLAFLTADPLPFLCPLQNVRATFKKHVSALKTELRCAKGK